MTMTILRNAALVTLASVGLLTASEAQSLNQKQRNLLNHIAQVMVIQNNCPEYESNDSLIAIMLTYYKLNLSDKSTELYLKGRYIEQEKGLNAGKTLACLVGWSLYGKGGQNVPDLLTKR